MLRSSVDKLARTIVFEVNRPALGRLARRKSGKSGAVLRDRKHTAIMHCDMAFSSVHDGIDAHGKGLMRSNAPL